MWCVHKQRTHEQCSALTDGALIDGALKMARSCDYAINICIYLCLYVCRYVCM